MYKKYKITTVALLLMASLVQGMEPQKVAVARLYRGKTNPNLNFDSVLYDNELVDEEELTKFVSQTLSPPLQALLTRVKNSTSFKDFTPKTLLLEGESGAGKTLTAKAFAQQSGKSSTFVRSALIADEYEDTVECTLEELRTRMKSQQHIIVFDDIQSLVNPEHEIVLKKFLADCVGSNKFIIATAEQISPSFRDFFSNHCKQNIIPIVSAVTDDMRKRILLIHLLQHQVILNENNLEQLAKKLRGASNRELGKIVSFAYLQALYRDKRNPRIAIDDFNSAVLKLEEDSQILRGEEQPTDFSSLSDSMRDILLNLFAMIV